MEIIELERSNELVSVCFRKKLNIILIFHNNESRGFSESEISKMSSCGWTFTNRSIRFFIRQGIIKEDIDRNDTRKKIISLTDNGALILKKLYPAIRLMNEINEKKR